MLTLTVLKMKVVPLLEIKVAECKGKVYANIYTHMKAKGNSNNTYYGKETCQVIYFLNCLY